MDAFSILNWVLLGINLLLTGSGLQTSPEPFVEQMRWRCSRSLHADFLVCAPRPQLVGLGRANPLDANACVLAATNRVRSPDHFPLTSLIGNAIPYLELHGEDTNGARWCGRGHPR